MLCQRRVETSVTEWHEYCEGSHVKAEHLKSTNRATKTRSLCLSICTAACDSGFLFLYAATPKGLGATVASCSTPLARLASPVRSGAASPAASPAAPGTQRSADHRPRSQNQAQAEAAHTIFLSDSPEAESQASRIIQWKRPGTCQRPSLGKRILTSLLELGEVLFFCSFVVASSSLTCVASHRGAH